MPEGDSIVRVATQLRPHLEGVPLTAVVIGGVVRHEAANARAVAVTPLGKHLLIDLSPGWQLRIHLGMNGRWRRFRAGGDPPPPSASLILATATDAFACLRAKTVVELTARRDPRHGRAIATLGPDVLAADFDPAVAAARAAATGGELGQVLLDQRVACGIGNVYKCEALFFRRASPFADTRGVAPDQLAALYACASQLMRANLTPGPRRTRAGPDRYHVYRRAGQPCPRCGTRIATAVQGATTPRTTYYCPTCQPTPPGVTPRQRRGARRV